MNKALYNQFIVLSTSKLLQTNNNDILYIKNNNKIKPKIIDNQVDEENFHLHNFIF
jgi:hypothetical protein